MSKENKKIKLAPFEASDRTIDLDNLNELSVKIGIDVKLALELDAEIRQRLETLATTPTSHEEKDKVMQDLVENFQNATGQEWRDTDWLIVFSKIEKDKTVSFEGDAENTYSEKKNKERNVKEKISKKTRRAQELSKKILTLNSDDKKNQVKKLKSKFVELTGILWHEGIRDSEVSAAVNSYEKLKKQINESLIDIDIEHNPDVTEFADTTIEQISMEADDVPTELVASADKLADNAIREITELVDASEQFTPLTIEGYRKALENAWQSAVETAAVKAGIKDQEAIQSVVSRGLQNNIGIVAGVFDARIGSPVQNRETGENEYITENLPQSQVELDDDIAVLEERATQLVGEISTTSSTLDKQVLQNANDKKKHGRRPKKNPPSVVSGSQLKDGSVVFTGDTGMLTQKKYPEPIEKTSDQDTTPELSESVFITQEDFENQLAEIGDTAIEATLKSFEQDENVAIPRAERTAVANRLTDYAASIVEAQVLPSSQEELTQSIEAVRQAIDDEAVRIRSEYNNFEKENDVNETKVESGYEQHFDRLREFTQYRHTYEKWLHQLRSNPKFVVDIEKVQQAFARFQNEIAQLPDHYWEDEAPIIDRTKLAEQLAYYEALLAYANDPSLGEPLEHEKSTLEKEQEGNVLRNVELSTSDIEAVFAEHPELINQLKELLKNAEGGGQSALKDAILAVLEKHFKGFLSDEQYATIENQLAPLAESAANDITRSYEQSLDLRAREQVGFFKKLISKISSSRMRQMAATVAVGLGAAVLAPVIAPALGVSAAAMGFIGGATLRTGVGALFRRFTGSRSLQKEREELDKKEQKNIQTEKERILEEGYQVRDREDEWPVQLIDAKSLALAVRNSVRMETNAAFRKDEIMDAGGHLNQDAAKSLYENIFDTCKNNTITRLEIEHKLRQRFQEQGNDFDGLEPAEQQQYIDQAIERETKFLFTKYSFELTQQKQMELYMERTKQEGGGEDNAYIVKLRKVQAAMSGDFMALGNERGRTVGRELAHVAGAGVIGAMMYEAYQHSSAAAGVSAGVTGAVMGHEYGKSKAEKTVAEAYHDEMRQVMADAETQLNAAIHDTNPDLGELEEAVNKMQGLLTMIRPKVSAEDAPQPFIDDIKLRHQATEFIDQYHRLKLEAGDLKPMTPQEQFEQAMQALHAQIERERKESAGRVDRRVADAIKTGKRMTLVYTALGGAAAALAGIGLRSALHHDRVAEEVKVDQSSESELPDRNPENFDPNNPPITTMPGDHLTPPHIKGFDDLPPDTSIVDEDFPSGSNDTSLDKELPSDTSIVNEPKSSGGDIQIPTPPEFEPVIKGNIWNTIETNLKEHPMYKGIIERAMEKDPSIDFDSLTLEQLRAFDLDKLSLGTTAIDKLKDTLVQSLAAGETKYLDTVALKALGLDNFKDLNFNSLTSEQMKAIDWKELLENEDNLKGVTKALDLNDTLVADKHILAHNRALNELADKGAVDWDANFDKAAEAYEQWKADNPGGSVEQYLQSATDATAEEASVGQELPEGGESLSDDEKEAKLTDYEKNLQDQGFKGIDLYMATFDDAGEIDRVEGTYEGIRISYVHDHETSLVEFSRMHDMAQEVKQFLVAKHLGIDFDQYSVSNNGNIYGVAFDVPGHEDVISLNLVTDGEKVMVKGVELADGVQEQGLSEKLINLVEQLKGKAITAPENTAIFDGIKQELAHQGTTARIVEGLSHKNSPNYNPDTLADYLENHPDGKFYLPHEAPAPETSTPPVAEPSPATEANATDTTDAKADTAPEKPTSVIKMDTATEVMAEMDADELLKVITENKTGLNSFVQEVANVIAKDTESINELAQVLGYTPESMQRFVSNLADDKNDFVNTLADFDIHSKKAVYEIMTLVDENDLKKHAGAQELVEYLSRSLQQTKQAA